MIEEPNEESLQQAEAVVNDILDAFFALLDAWDKAKEENKGLLNESYQHVGRVINCHLIIENLINTKLKVLGKANSARFKRNGLTFNQKLKMLPTKGHLYCFLIPGIFHLNDLRNHFVHNLKATIEESEMRLINRYLQIFKKSLSLDITVEERLEEFTKLCITAFTLKDPSVTLHIQKLYNKYPNLQNMIEEISDRLDA